MQAQQDLNDTSSNTQIKTVQSFKIDKKAKKLMEALKG